MKCSNCKYAHWHFSSRRAAGHCRHPNGGNRRLPVYEKKPKWCPLLPENQSENSEKPFAQKNVQAQVKIGPVLQFQSSSFAETDMQAEEKRIYQDTIKMIQAFLNRPEMYVGLTAEAAEISWMNYLSFLDIIEGSIENTLSTRWAKFRRDIQNTLELPSVTILSADFTFEEIISFCREFYEKEIAELL